MPIHNIHSSISFVLQGDPIWTILFGTMASGDAHQNVEWSMRSADKHGSIILFTCLEMTISSRYNLEDIKTVAGLSSILKELVQE